MWIDVAVIVVYLAAAVALGIRASRAGTVKDYFLGGRKIHWAVACFSIVATETSALTFISLPGMAYVKGIGFLHVTLGYVLGRVLVAFILLPRYFAGEMETAYHFLQHRFGVNSRRAMSVVFHVTRVAADSIRLFCTAIPLALLMGMGDSYLLPIIIMALASLIYTYVGGISSVAVVDTMQLFLYIICAVVGIVVVVDATGLALGDIFARIPAERLNLFTIGPEGLLGGYNVFSGVIGGALLSFATHGTDHLLVQRVLSCDGLSSARKAIIGSGIVVFLQCLLFLALGLVLLVFYGGRDFAIPDSILPYFIVNDLPHGLKGLMLAGIFAVSMSTLASTINSLSSSTAFDLMGLSEREMPEKKKVRISRFISLAWAVVLTGVSLLFTDTRSPLVELALGIASVTSGGMLGIFIMGIVKKDFIEKAALAGVMVSIGAVGSVAVLNALRMMTLFWPWFVPMGFCISLCAGFAADVVMRALRRS